MNISAVAAIAKARWWILAAAALLAVVITGMLAQYQEDNRITHEAVSSVTFTEDPTSLDRGDFEEYLADQHLLAEDVNSDLLGETPGPFLPWELADIDLENDQNQILFIGRGYSQEEANEVARAMRDRYLSISTVGAGAQRMSQDLDEVTREIEDLRAEIAASQAEEPPTEDETVTQTRRAALEARALALQNRYGALGVEMNNPVERSREAVEAEMGRVLQDLTNVQLELSQIPLPPDPTEPAAQTELFDDLRLTQLEARWTQLYSQLSDLEALATFGEVVPQEPTIVGTSGRSNQLLAFVGAIVIAMLALVGIERTRGVVWAKSELKGGSPVLTELPPRQLHTFRRPSDDPWYIKVPTGRRKAAVQLIRSQLDAYRNVALAFQGMGVYDDDTLDLTADIAMSAAVSGRNVLLVDATFSGRASQVEYDGGESPSLIGLLRDLPDDPEAAMAEIKTTLLEVPETSRHLRSLRSGAEELDAGDALASHRFGMFLDVARENFDLVLISGASYGEPTSHILAQRVDSVIFVGSIGHTIDRQVEAAERDFQARRASLAGIVMVRRRRSRLKRWLSPRLRQGIWNGIDWLGKSKTEDSEETHEVSQDAEITEMAAVEGGVFMSEEERAAEVDAPIGGMATTEVSDELVVNLVDDAVAAPDELSPEDDGLVRSGPQRFMDRLRSMRDHEAPPQTGFQKSLERFGVSDLSELSDRRYPGVDGLVAVDSGDYEELPSNGGPKEYEESGDNA